MNYEKAYKLALERAKDYHDKGYFMINAAIEKIFPELAESEDERIRKWLIAQLQIKIGDNAALNDMIYKALAWLEKQGEKSQGKTALEAINEEKVDNRNCVNPTDKVEPKFNVGDWIVQENIGVYKIIEVCESWYEVIDVEDNHYSIAFDKEYMCHLWAIENAKDGDVLCVKYGNDEMPFIFTGKQDDIAYCALNSFGEFVLSMAEWLLHTTVLPATKEQRDLLFAKMKEAGYMWDAEKKELKKLTKFKFGDTIVDENEETYEVIEVGSFYYTIKDHDNNKWALVFDEENKYSKAGSDFDIDKENYGKN